MAIENENPEAQGAEEKEVRQVDSLADLDKEIEEGEQKEEKEEREEKEESGEEVSTDALVEKAKTEGIEKLSKEEKDLLVEKGLLVKEGEEEEGEDDNIGKDFKAAIESITGVELDIDLTETPINTPEGLAKYVDSFAEKRIEEFEAQLAERFPTAYKALLIESEGGDLNEYFKSSNVGEMDYTKVQLSEEDTSQHKKIIRDSLKLKGLDEETINDIITLAEDNKKLKEKAAPELKFLKDTQEKRAEAYTKDLEKRKMQDLQVMQGMANTIKGLVTKGEIGNFNIPKSDINSFSEHLLKSVQYKDGRFFLTREVSPENLEQIAQGEFFNFKKGNLDKYVKREADKKLVLKLKSNASKDKLRLGGEREGLKGYTPLGEL